MAAGSMSCKGWAWVLTLLAGAGVLAEEPQPRLRFHGESSRRIYRNGQIANCTWKVEQAKPPLGSQYRLRFSSDGGSTWKDLYHGTSLFFRWEIDEKVDVSGGRLRVDLLDAAGAVLVSDEIQEVVIDSTVPDVAAQVIAVSSRRDVPVHIKINRQGATGVEIVQLWVTPDGGKRWQYMGSGRGSDPTILLRGEKGRYGVLLTGVSRTRVVEPAPNPGDAPEAEVEISPEEPFVELDVGPVQRFYVPGEVIRFNWSVEDEDLIDRSVTAEYRTVDGQWVALVSEGARKGEHAWKLPEITMGISGIRVSARDRRGNAGEKVLPISCFIDADPPKGVITSPALWSRAVPKEVEVQYRINEVGSGLERAELLFRRGAGEDWQSFAKLPLAGNIARKELPDGVYEFVLSASDRAGNRLRPDSQKPFRAVVDRLDPEIDVKGVSMRLDGFSIEWEARDANLSEAPVKLFHKDLKDPEWKLLKEGLPAAGTWQGSLPEGVKQGDSITLRVFVEDLAGKSASKMTALQVEGVSPKVRISRVKFADLREMVVEWEASGEGLAPRPVNAQVWLERDGSRMVLRTAGELEAAGSLEVRVPPDVSLAENLFVEVACVNRWGNTSVDKAVVQLGGTLPTVRVTRVVCKDGKVLVGWDASGGDLGSDPVSIEYEAEEGNWIQARKNLPLSGEIEWELPKIMESAVKIRVTCQDRKGRSSQTMVHVLPGGSGATSKTPGVEIQEISRDGRRLSLRWRSSGKAASANPVAVECEDPALKSWAPVHTGLPAEGAIEWEVPERFGKSVNLRMAFATADGTVCSEPRSIDLGKISVHTPDSTGPMRVRAVWGEGVEEAPVVAPPRVLPIDPLRRPRDWLSAGKAEEAHRFLETYLAVQPESQEAYRLLIRASRLMGKPADEVIRLYRRILALSPRDTELLNEIGLFHMLEVQDDKRALEYFQEALQSGSSPATYHNLGRLYFRAREYRLSAAALEKAVELEPQMAEAWFLLAQAYTETPLRDIDRAKKLWKKVRDLSRDDPARRKRADAELRQLGVH